mgnify:CR=1 FL=1
MLRRPHTGVDSARPKWVSGLFGLWDRSGHAHALRLISPVRGCWIALALALGLAIQGCGWGASRDEQKGAAMPSAEEGRGVFSEPTTGERDASGDADADASWSIVLVTLPEGAESVRDEVLGRVRERDGIGGVRAQTRSGRIMILTGSYDGPNDPRAMEDLERFHTLEVNGRRPYARAYLTPPSPESLKGSNPEFDLRTAKERFGDGAAYTLQIGVYGTLGDESLSAEKRREFRDAAEGAVAALRAEGERAFYYHAPNMSMVTVGVLRESEFDPSTMPPIESDRLKALREQYPHNLLNGQGIRQTETTDTGQRVTRLQPSRLVGIPEPE